MQQPPSDRSNKNPYATPSAWPRAPQQTFHLKVPKAPPGTAQAAKPPRRPQPPQAPARPASAILSGSALPTGYNAPQHVPEVEPVAEVFVPVEPAIEETPPPAFVAPPETPFVAPLRTAGRGKGSRAPLFIGAALAVTAGLAAAAWLLLREPETSTVIEPAQAPARAPVIVPPSLDYIMTEEEAAGEPALREPTQTAAASPAPSTRAAQAAPAVELPSGPVAYSGGVAPAVTPPPPPVAVQPRPAPPLPPASAPGPATPLADPDAPQTTRDPSSGN